MTSTTSSRAWPGVRAWAISVLSAIAVFEFLAVFAWRAESGRLFDPAIIIIAIPAGTFALILFFALLLAWLAKTPLTASLPMIARFLPLGWALPIIDLIQSYGNGVIADVPHLNGGGLILASLTGGLFPLANGLPIGVRFGIFAGALILAIAVWHSSKSIVRAAIAAFAWSAVAVHLVTALSAYVYWRSPFASGAWNSEPYEIGRRLVAVLSQSYWWNSIYERFITSIASQPDVAGSCVIAAIALIALGIFLILAFVTRAGSMMRILKHAFYSWGTFDLVLYVAVGIGAAVSAHAIPATGSFSVLATALFLILLALLRFGAVMKRDLFSLGADERSGVKQPIASGDLAPDDARAFADISVAYVLSASWILGWPVVAPVLAYLSASRLTRERSALALSWAPAAYRAVGAGALAFASLAFISQDANIGALALTASAIAAGHRLFVELFWMPRMRRGAPRASGLEPRGESTSQPVNESTSEVTSFQSAAEVSDASHAPDSESGMMGEG